MTTTHAVNLLLRNLLPEARLGHRLPGLMNNLLSVTALVDAGCEVFFHRTGCEVTFDGTVILRGWRDPKYKLWRVKIVDDGWTTDLHMPIPDSDPEPPTIALVTPPTAWANSLYECSTTHKLTHFYYAHVNFPIMSTLILALNAGYLKGFLGLTAGRVRRHINVSIDSEHGHMDQVRQGIRSTKPVAAASPIVLLADYVDTNMDAVPQEPTNERTHHVFMTVCKVTGNVSSDQSGCFPVISNHGNVYVALFYVHDPNYIKSVPIKNQSKEELLQAYMKVYAWLTTRGYRPLLHKLDNETSRDIEAFIAAEQVMIQHMPPDMHHTNPVKPAIRTWKNHFTAGIAGIPSLFTIAN
jgi:hypothetical protein